MSSRFKIRAATLDDVQHIRALLIETWHAAYDGILGPQAVDQKCGHYFHERAIEYYVGKGALDWFAVVLSEENEMAGLIMARPGAFGAADINMLYVRPKFQRKGIGRALVATTERLYPFTRWMSLEVLEPNAAAIAFYKRLGFERWHRSGGWDGVPIIRMTRRMRPDVSWYESLRAFLQMKPVSGSVFDWDAGLGQLSRVAGASCKPFGDADLHDAAEDCCEIRSVPYRQI